MRRLHRMLAGTDGPGKRAIPAGEFLHPVPLTAVALLGINDHILKGSGWLPAAVTGKLSDVMGFIFFPLLCTALVDVGLWGLSHLGLRRVKFSLGMGRTTAAILFTAGLMAAIKLSRTAADAVEQLLGLVGFPATIVVDPADLLPLPALAIAYVIARGEVRRVPLGRLEYIERSGADPATALCDVERAGADPQQVAELARAFGAYLTSTEPAPAAAALARLRDR